MGAVDSERTEASAEGAPLALPRVGPRRPLSQGEVLAGRYRVVRLLAEGGMGAVYEAEDLELSLRVALKCLRPQPGADPRAEARLKREIAMARRVTHPNVCRIFDLGAHRSDGASADPPLLFFTMELIEGETLQQRLVRRGRLSQAEAFPLVRQMAAALAAAHDADVIHRDFKSGNVILAPGAQGERAVVTDFGIAIAARGVQGGKEDLGLLGTPAYMAPEQVSGEPVGQAADIYALGVVLYEMLTGRRPFVDPDAIQQALQRLGEAPPSPRSLVPDLDVRWEAAILRCLERSPQDRFLSAADIVRAVAETAFEVGVPLLKTVVAVRLDRPERLRVVEELGQLFAGQPIQDGGGWLVLFERPVNAVGFALSLQQTLATLAREPGTPRAGRAGIHLGEVVLEQLPAGAAASLLVKGAARPLAEGLAALAAPGQTLLSRAAFDLARRAEVETLRAPGPLRWIAHGSYVFQGLDEPTEVFEVGVPGRSPLSPPPASGAAERVPGDSTILGWRPAPGMEMPFRSGWRLLRKLGAGGFGEVWLAGLQGTGERRVFKFCFEAERLRALQREVSLFRLLQEALGERGDIARVLSWNFTQAPYFLESEYSEGGGLDAWAEEQGGIGRVEFAARLEILAQAAEALAAAHSVGVLHKDVKPANLLIEPDAQGRPRVRLTDFGIGLATDRDRFAQLGITALAATAAGTTDAAATLAGTRLYMAPEILEGRPATLQADVYALGVILYQLVAGDLGRSLAPGWERDVDDELLREDIAAAVDGAPQRRLGNALRLAERLRSLDARRERRKAERQAELLALRAQRRRRLALPALLVLTAVAGSIGWGAYRSWTAAARARAAQAFGRRVEQIEALARYAHLLPLHDVRQEYAEIRERMLAIEGESKALGDLGRGPGAYALGRGHLVLGEPGAARRRLEEAWAAGFREPEAAHALGVAHGQLYQQGLREAEAILDRRLREARRKALEAAHRDPAARLLRQAASGGVDLAVEAEELIAFYEGRLDAALPAPRASSARPLWLYETRVFEGDVHLHLARERRSNGAFAGAVEAYERARAVFESAAAVAQSDPQVHERICLVGVHTADMRREATGGDVLKPLREAEAACDRALVAHADRPQTLALASRLQRVRGEYLWSQGQDPAPSYERAVALAERALAGDAANAEALSNKGTALYMNGAYQFRRGRDPRPFFDPAVAALDRVLALGGGSVELYDRLANAWGYRGEWELSQGLDPRASMQASIRAAERGLELDPGFDGLFNNLGVTYDELGKYLASRGLDADPAFESATRAYKGRLALNPHHRFTLNNMAHNFAHQAAFLREHGRDPRALLEEALALLDRALAPDDRYDSPYHNRGLAHVELAELALAEGRDPGEHTAAARASHARALQLNGRNKPWNFADAAAVELLDARFLIERGRSPAVPLAAARRLLETASTLHPGLASIHWRLGQAALLEARSGARAGRSQDATFREAARQIDQALAHGTLAAAAATGIELAVEWASQRVNRGVEAAQPLAIGDRMERLILETAPALPRHRALVGRLHLARAGSARDPVSRRTALVRCIEELAAALGGNRHLDREFRPSLEQAQALLGRMSGG